MQKKMWKIYIKKKKKNKILFQYIKKRRNRGLFGFWRGKIDIIKLLFLLN